MKLRLKRKSVYALEDVLLDVYNGLPVASLEGDDRIRVILDKIQDAIYIEDIFSEDV